MIAAMRRNPWPVLFLAPALILFAALVGWPVMQSLALSFTRWDGFDAPQFIGLANYAELLNDPLFYVSLKNNLLWLLLFLLCPPIGLALALYLNQRFGALRLVRSLFFFPFVLSQVVVGLVFSWFLDPGFGLLAVVAGWLGLDAVAVLAHEDWATLGIIAAGLWPQIAYAMILYLAGLTALDSELIEAGRLDGAKGWTLLRHVILPQLRPATFLVMVVTIIGALRSFDLVAIMTAGGPYGRSSVLAFYMYEQALLNYRIGYGAAIATVLFLIMSVYIAWFLTRMIRQERGQ